MAASRMWALPSALLHLLPHCFLHFSVGAVYHAPLLALAESGERKVYLIARCRRAVVDSVDTATGNRKCTVLSSGKRRVPSNFFVHIFVFFSLINFLIYAELSTLYQISCLHFSLTCERLIDCSFFLLKLNCLLMFPVSVAYAKLL